MSIVAFSPALGQGVATLRTPDPEAEPTPAAPSEELDAQEGILAFAACMRDNGIDFPDPQFGVGGGFFGGGGPGGDGPAIDFQSPLFQAAIEACGSFLQALQPDLDPEQQVEQRERQLALAECMRSNGIDFPDPDPNGGFGFRRGAAGGLDFADPAFQDAFRACQEEIGGFGFGPGGGQGANGG
jgi:hypothetical protein